MATDEACSSKVAETKGEGQTSLRDQTLQIGVLQVATERFGHVGRDEARYLPFCKETESLVEDEGDLDSVDDQADVDDYFYDLGPQVRRELFQCYGIRQLHPWQKEMLQEQVFGVGDAKNGLVVAPTSGGQTLVAVVLILRTLIVEEKDAILALPYVAIVEEKVADQEVGGQDRGGHRYGVFHIPRDIFRGGGGP